MDSETAAGRESARGQSMDEPPPFLGSWERVYVAVLAYLVVLISVLYLVTRELAY